jgi:hypothetical protein
MKLLQLTVVTDASTMTFSTTIELWAFVVVGALTRTGVLEAAVSIKFKRPLPPLVVSIPVVQPTKRRA